MFGKDNEIKHCIIILSIILVIVLAQDYFDIFKDANLYAYGIITGLITAAMWFIDNENKKRWENDYFSNQKSKYRVKSLVAIIYLGG